MQCSAASRQERTSAAENTHKQRADRPLCISPVATATKVIAEMTRNQFTASLRGAQGAHRGQLGPRGGPQRQLEGRTAERQHTQGVTNGSTYARMAAPPVNISQEEKQNYSKLMEQANKTNPTLNISATKTSENVSDMSNKEWCKMLFQKFEIKMSDIEGVVFSSDGENCELQLKPNVDPAVYSSKQTESADGRDFKIKGTNKQTNTVVFKEVPLTCPDLELTHLIRCHGGVIKEGDEVKHETISLADPTSGQEVSVRTSTRSIEAIFPSNRRPKTFYWLAGPARDDKLHRIIVQHPSQIGRQCGNCLRVSTDPTDPCKFNGKTAQCRKSGERCSLAAYFRKLKLEEGYTSVRNLFNYADLEARKSEETFSSDFLGRDDELEMNSTAKGPRVPRPRDQTTTNPEGSLGASSDTATRAPPTPSTQATTTPEGPPEEPPRQSGPMIALEGPTGPQRTAPSGPPGSDEKEQWKKSMIQNTVTYLRSKLEDGGELPSNDMEYFTSQLLTIDNTRYHLVDGKAVAKEGSDPLLEVKIMMEELKRQTGISNCDVLLQHLSDKMSTKATVALLARVNNPTKVQRTRSKSRPRSLDDEGELGAKSNKQAKLDGEQSSAKRYEVFTKVANLINQSHPNAQELDNLGDELADLPPLLDLHRGHRFSLNNHGQLALICKTMPDWPWRDLTMIMETKYPGYDQKQMEKFISFTHAKIRNLMFNHHKLDQELRRQIEVQDDLLPTFEDTPYSDFDEEEAAQWMMDPRAKEADKVTGEKDSSPEGGEEEKEKEKKKEKTAEVKKANKKTKESTDSTEVGNKEQEEMEFPPLGTSPRRIAKPSKATTSPLGKSRRGKR